MKFKSDRDFLFKFILKGSAIGFLVIITLMFTLSFVRIIPSSSLFITIWPAAMSAICFIIYYEFSYLIQDKRLYIKIAGIIVYKLHLSRIDSIGKKYRSTYVYGLSGDVVSLKFSSDSFTMHMYREVNVSPKDKKGFIEAILNEYPNIKVDPKLVQKHGIEIKEV
jgi:hypothetical protein